MSLNLSLCEDLVTTFCDYLVACKNIFARVLDAHPLKGIKVCSTNGHCLTETIIQEGCWFYIFILGENLKFILEVFLLPIHGVREMWKCDFSNIFVN